MKIIIMFFMLIINSLSCNNENVINKTTQSNERLVKLYFEHFNNHDWHKMANMYAPTADFKDPSFGKGVVKQTREQVVKKYSELNQVFPNIKDDILNVYPSGNNHIVVEFMSKGTAVDGSQFELPICTIFTIQNGLITKDFTYFDNFEE